MPVSSCSTKAWATSTYSDTTTRPGTSLRCSSSWEPARGIATLVHLAGARPRPGLRLGIDGDDAVAERELFRHRKIHQRARGFDRDDLEMDGVAADHAAERDRGVIGLSVLLCGIERDGD